MGSISFAGFAVAGRRGANLPHRIGYIYILVWLWYRAQKNHPKLFSPKKRIIHEKMHEYA